ncbi:MAG: hypothetical protein C4342_08355 [Armatimonadota bacterium]
MLGYRRIAFLGNGLSILPHLFVYYGFHVVITDISHAAISFARDNPPTEEQKIRFNEEKAIAPPWEDRARKSLEENCRPGGQTEFVVTDLFEHQLTNECFDATIMQHAVHHFNSHDRQSLARNIYDLIAPGGVLIVESHKFLLLLDPMLSYDKVNLIDGLKNTLRHRVSCFT